MTDAQKFRFYFPAWTACVRANGWHMAKGRLAGAIEPGTRSAEHSAVIEHAQRFAVASGRTLNLETLRHGAHIVALGRDKSSADLSNQELERVVALFAVVADPDDLAARLTWDAYQRGEDPGAVKRVEWFIRRCPDAYARAVAQDKFGTRQWENLTLAQKRTLSLTLKNRFASRPEPKPAPVDAENNPF